MAQTINRSPHSPPREGWTLPTIRLCRDNGFCSEGPPDERRLMPASASSRPRPSESFSGQCNRPIPLPLPPNRSRRPVGYREADLEQCLQDLGGNVVSTVFVADDRRHAHLSVGWHAALVIGFAKKCIEHALGNAGRLPQPDRRPNDQDIVVDDTPAQLGPIVASPSSELTPGLML